MQTMKNIHPTEANHQGGNVQLSTKVTYLIAKQDD